MAKFLAIVKQKFDDQTKLVTQMKKDLEDAQKYKKKYQDLEGKYKSL